MGIKKRLGIMAMAVVTVSSAMAQQPVDYVNPIIGTNGMGHTFPGACTPFGWVQLSPDTDTIPHNVNGAYQKNAYEYCAGYQYRDKTIVGFSHTHLSGTGHSDLGDILLMPAVGELKLNPGRADYPDEGYRSRFSHATEKAAPGYYEVMLDDYGIKAQLTATQRVGIHKYTFPKGKDGHLILDLRNNGGGLLESATQIVGMFVPKGKEVVSTKGKISQWDRTYRTPGEPLDTVMPMAVLINGASASAAEIVSGSLQDMDRAVLIGQRSFGKGLVQSPRELPYNGSVKVTMSKYYIPSGRCIQQMDYSHRKADGSVGAIPDSLTSVFYTSKGRPVRDGGGITPDFKIEEPETPTMMFYLVTDFLLTDFVAEWSQKHKKIAPPEDFEVTDEDFEAFKQYAKEKNFTYDRQSEKLLKNLKEVAKFEGYMDNDSTIFNSLEAKLTPDLDRDFDRNKDQIKKLLTSEIMKRYYFQKGELINSLKEDDVLDKALEVLGDPALYQQTLEAPGKVEKTATL